MEDQDDNYNDDFSDSEPPNNQVDDDQDEQHTQKVNGQIETLQLAVDDLQRELAFEKRNHEDTKQQYETELNLVKVAAKEECMITSGEDESQLVKYKFLCTQLKDRLDEALTVSPAETCPFTLREEFYKYCKKNLIFPEFKSKDMSVANCIKVLNSTKVTKPKQSDSAKAPANQVMSSETLQFTERIRLLEEELRLALGAAEDIRALKAKLLQMIERTRVEKEHKLRAEMDFSNARKKIEMLSEHMEKLMVHLKHEGAHKARIAEQHRLSERECNKVREKCDLVSRKGAAKDRLILELREGSKVLEDQLRLMDEKYLELRTKLDWARELGTKKVKRAEKTAADLRMKFALSGNSTLLDNMPLPDIYNPNNSQMTFDDQNSWVSGMMSNNNFQQQHNQSIGKIPGSKQQRVHTSKSTTSLQKPSQGGVNGGASLQSLESLRKSVEPDMDSVLEKIRCAQGGKVEWTEDKIKKLTAVSR
jgi:hypothetical protein